MTNPITYLQGVQSELKKVQWPTPKTVGVYFLAVVVGVALGAGLIYVFDIAFLKALELILN